VKKFLKLAVSEGIINQTQAEKLQELISKNSPFKISNLLIYFGGLIALGSVTFFITIGFLSQGYLKVIVSILIFGTIFYFILKKIEDNVAKGVLALYIVGLVPVLIYAIMAYFGIWDIKDYKNYYRFINMKYLILEISTIIVAFYMLKKFKLPILVLPIAFSLWFMSMDIVDLLFNPITWEDRRIISIVFGFYTLIFAYFIKNSEYAFWLYIFGVIMFWSGISLSFRSSELSKFIYFLINIGLLFVGIKLKRKVFLVFGTLGVIIYLGHLSYKFKDSAWFVYVVTFIGLLIVLLGVKFKEIEKNLKKITINKSVIFIISVLPFVFLVWYLLFGNESVIVVCKNKEYELKVKNDFYNKVYIYKHQRFNSIKEFKSKYCK